MKPYTDITILLDRSGSMESIKSAMEEGFNGFLVEHRKTPTTKITLVQFDSTPFSVLGGAQALALDTIYQNKPVLEVPTLTLQPRGGTPLIDALCQTIDATGDRLRKMPADLRPTGVLFVVITDGEENMSRIYKRADVKARIERQEGTYSWQFVFLGANQDAISEASSYGIQPQHAITYNGTLAGTRSAFNNFATKSATFTTSVSSGNTVAASANSLNYTKQDREDVAAEKP